MKQYSEKDKQRIRNMIQALQRIDPHLVRAVKGGRGLCCARINANLALQTDEDLRSLIKRTLCGFSWLEHRMGTPFISSHIKDRLELRRAWVCKLIHDLEAYL